MRRRAAAVVLFVMCGCSGSDSSCRDPCEWVVFGDLKRSPQPTATLQATLRVGETIDVSPVLVRACTPALSVPDLVCGPISATRTSSDPVVATVAPASGGVNAVVLARSVGATVISASVVGRQPASGNAAPPAGQTKENLTITVTP